MQRTPKRAAPFDLGARFVAALEADFRKHGPSAIEALREDRPADYLKAVAAHLPPSKEAEDADAAYAPYSDAEIIAVIEELRAGRGGPR